MLKKLLCVSLSMLLAAALFAGCNGEEEPDENTFVHWTFHDGVVFEAEMFMEAYPDINVIVEVFPGGEFESRLMMALATDTLPDSFDLEEGWLGNFIDLPNLADLSPLGVAELTVDIFPYLVAMGTDSSGVIRGVANNISPVAYWFNRSAAREWLGTDDADEIADMLGSWEQIWEMAEQIREASDGEVWLWPNISEIPKLMGPNLPNLVPDRQFVWDDAWFEMVEVMRHFEENNLHGNLGSWSGEWASAWNDGTLIIRVMPSWDFFASAETREAGNMGVARPHLAAYEGALIRSINADSDRQELAFEWLRFTNSRDFQIAHLEEMNQMPANMRVVEELMEDFSHPQFGGQNIIRTYYEIARNIPEATFCPYYRTFVNRFGSTAVRGVREGMTNDEILDLFIEIMSDIFPHLF